MARKEDTPQKAMMRELMQSYLKENDVKIKDGTDVNSIMRDMMSVILEGALDEELEQELGYSKYDYRNKDTDNSRNGHSQKTMHTSYGDMQIDAQGTEMENLNHRSLKNTRIPLHGTWRKKSYPCMRKEWPQPISKTI